MNTALSTYVVLTECASNEESQTDTTVSLAQIAAMVGISRRTVIGIIQELEAVGVIDVQRHRVGRVNLPSTYWLVSGEALSPVVQSPKSIDVAPIRTNEEQSLEQSYEENPRFLLFWNDYPRKVGKKKAFEAFCKISPDDDMLAVMLSTLADQKESAQWQEDRFIPHPSTWLNQQRWEDEVEAEKETADEDYWGDD